MGSGSVLKFQAWPRFLTLKPGQLLVIFCGGISTQKNSEYFSILPNISLLPRYRFFFTAGGEKRKAS
jgi:hypothetical protein